MAPRSSLLRPITAALILSLSSIVILANQAEPPVVDPSTILLLDEGQEAIVSGLLVDLRRYDSGFESLVLSSPDGLATLRIQVEPGIRPQPSAYVRLGDSLRVVGRLSSSGSEMVLCTDGDSVSVESRAESSLTVDTLSRTWHLLLGDELRIKGFVVAPSYAEGERLYDGDFQHSILLAGASGFQGSTISEEVVVAGILRLDPRSMVLFLEVVSMMTQN